MIRSTPGRTFRSLFSTKPMACFVLMACLTMTMCAWMASADAAGFDCGKFQKNADGSWRATQTVEIYGPRGRIDFTPDETYRQGQDKLGLDMAKLLDANCDKK